MNHPYETIAKMCGLFGKSRQAFHQMERRHVRQKVNDEMLLVYVKEIRRQQPRIGTRKLHSMLKPVMASNAIKLGRDKFFALLRKRDLLVKRRRKHVRTTDSEHVYKKYPNLIEQYVARGPEQIWASDITYLSTEKGFVYLSLVTDQYSKKIMGYHVHPTLETNGPLKALTMALKGRYYRERSLIHHSDRGIQYCCEEYISVLESNHIQISMSNRGNPYENAIAERVNGILKTEFYLDRFFKDITQVKQVVQEVVRVYNTQRPHASCDYMTPDQAHEHHGILRKRWKNYRPKQKPKDFQPIGEEVKKVLAQLLMKNDSAVLTMA
jgi:transposase InsO family protein